MQCLTYLRVVYVCCTMAGIRPLFRPPTLSIQRLSKSTRDSIDKCPDKITSQIGKGFSTPANRRLLNPAILRAIASTRMYLLFRELSFIGVIQPALGEVEFFFSRQRSVEYELMSMPFDMPPPALTLIQEAVRLTLMTFAFSASTRFVPMSAYTLFLVHKLKEALELLDLDSLWSSDLLLWLLFFGAHISRHLEERTWFIACLARNTTQLDLTSADAVQEVLLKFFYSERFSRDSLLEIWDEIGSFRQASSTEDSESRHYGFGGLDGD